MLSKELYVRLSKFKNSLQNNAVKGSELLRLIEIYKELSGDTHFRPHCKACLEDMFFYLKQQLIKYERNNPFYTS